MGDATERDAIGVLTAFLARYNDDVDRGHVRSLAEYQADFPGFEDVVAREYAELEGGASPRDESEEAIGRGRRYRVENEIARGGMGVVLRIWDHDLRRALAMKRLRTDRGSIPDHALERFLEEARVTAQLHHPGVVPVHDLGIDDSGRVYFTMDLVRGRAFDEIIELVAQGDAEWTRTRALGVVQRICEAVAYAHSKGVVHRDLKPANVMVGRFGEVYVMDWGLARAAEAAPGRALPDLRGDVEDGPGASIVVSARAESSSGSWTIEGDVVGTPAYMAPEQARGRLDAVGPRADVYAVGAILYHLLAGRMPYVDPSTASSSRELVEQVVAGPPLPLREVAPKAPAELVAICEQAMARDPDDRYADVRELGEDVRAFLESRVVRAYQRGAFAEARKWVQRNRLAAAGLLLAGVGLVGGLGVSLLENARADAQAARAEVSAQDAMDAVERMLARVGQNELKNVPQALPIRRQLLADALGFYEKFLRDRGDDPSIQANIAKSCVRIALLRQQVGELRAAETEGTAAVERLRAAIASTDDVGEKIALRRLIGTAQNLVATCRMDSGRADEAEAPYRDALATFAALIEDQPDEPNHQEEHARVATNIGVLLYKSGRYEDALEIVRAARAERQRLVERFGPDHAVDIANSANVEGAILGRLRRPDESTEAYRRAVAAYEEAVGRNPGDWMLLEKQASAMHNLGASGVHADYPDWAGEATQRAIEIRRRLVEDYPNVPRLSSSLGASLRVRATQLRRHGERGDAAPLIEEAVALGCRALRQSKDDSDVATDLYKSLTEGTAVARESGDHAWIASLTELVAEHFPDDPVRLATAGARFAQAFAIARSDQSLPAAERAAIATEYGRRAVTLLRLAVTAGYEDLARLESTLAPLRTVAELDAALDGLTRDNR